MPKPMQRLPPSVDLRCMNAAESESRSKKSTSSMLLALSSATTGGYARLLPRSADTGASVEDAGSAKHVEVRQFFLVLLLWSAAGRHEHGGVRPGCAQKVVEDNLPDARLAAERIEG